MTMTPIFDALCLELRGAGVSHPGAADGSGKPEPERSAEPQPEVRSPIRGSGTRNREQSSAPDGDRDGSGRHTFLIA